MPALQPPSMQIGALPPGWSPLPPTGPAATAGFVLATPSFIQQVAAATTIVTPASLTVTIAASTAGSTLIAGVAVAATGAAPVITPPANWVPMGGSTGANAGNTVGAGLYFLPGASNPGGITTIVFNVTNANGIAAWVDELGGNWLPSPYPASNSAANYTSGNYAGGSLAATNSSAAPTGVATVPQAGPVMLWGIEADVTGQAYTPVNVGGSWTAGTTATSTTGATLIVIRPFFQIANALQANISYQLKGTLAGALANAVATAMLPMALVDSLIQPFPQSEPGSGIQIGGWGPLGPTKPGGAGSGQ